MYLAMDQNTMLSDIFERTSHTIANTHVWIGERDWVSSHHKVATEMQSRLCSIS